MPSFQPFDDEPHLKARKPRDLRPRRECPLCLERAFVAGTLPSATGTRALYIVCVECGFHGEVDEAVAA